MGQPKAALGLGHYLEDSSLVAGGAAKTREIESDAVFRFQSLHHLGGEQLSPLSA